MGKRSAQKEKQTPRASQNGDGTQDERFKEVRYSAKFARKRQDEGKVRIDSRFAHMFTDEDFGASAGATPRVDKYGRTLDKEERGHAAELKRFYKVDSDQEGDDDDEADAKADKETGREKKVKAKAQKQRKNMWGLVEEEEEEEEEEKVPRNNDRTKKKVQTKKGNKNTSKDAKSRAAYLAKLARGEIEGGSSDESESSEESDSDLEASDVEDNDAEDNESIPMGDSTSRLAVQNLDWSRLRAQDILATLQSFLPTGGSIRSVVVYQSEFGEKRMKHEERYGPSVDGIEAQEASLDDPTNFEMVSREAGEGEGFDMQKLRKYELEKLKYYFAVAEFDSVESADHVYKECDGMEFERSSTVFDLRFVPEGLELDRPVRDRAEQMTDDYEAPEFVTKALQSTKVELTWDEDDYDRQKLQKWRARAPQKGNTRGQRVIGERELEAFIASDSDDDDDAMDDEDGRRRKSGAYRASLRAALLDAAEDEEGDGDDSDEAEEDDDDDDQAGVEADAEADADANGSTMSMTYVPEKDKDDDEVSGPKNDGFRDAFFADPERSSSKDKKNKKKKNNKKNNAEAAAGRDDARKNKTGKRRGRDAEPQDDDDGSDGEKTATDTKAAEERRRAREAAELELLLMEEKSRKSGPGLEGFDFKAIAEGEKLLRKKTKLRGKKRERKQEAVRAAKEDTFNVDTQDSRFSSMFEDPEYKLDRTNPNYSGTRGMQTLESEQLRRRGERKERKRRHGRDGRDADFATQQGGDAGAGADDLSLMVAAVKVKTQRAAKNKNKKRKT